MQSCWDRKSGPRGADPVRQVVNARLRRDPTRTTTLRRRFEAEAGRRMRAFRRAVRTAVVVRDVLALRANVEIPPNRAFDFPSDTRKVQEFMAWVQQMAEDEVLDVRIGTPLRSAAHQAWTATYIQSAYRRGLATASGELSAQGAEVAPEWLDAAFHRPVHADRAGMLYIRAFEDLRGVTTAMSTEMSRVLSEGIIEGQGPHTIARRLTDRVDKIGITRAKVLARTEVIRAHAEATLNTYEEAGVAGVRNRAEFSTSGDERVCPQCAVMEGREFSLQEARGIIPVHPNCRCAWIPVVVDARRLALR